MTNIEPRPPFPPFSKEDAIKKVRLAENGWNGKDPAKVAMAYTPDSRWRNRDQFINGREQICEFLSGKWQKEQGYKLVKELWGFTDNRIAVRFVYEWYDADGNWYRSHGNENWQFDENGLMAERHASINDVAIKEQDRLFKWEGAIRPDDHPGLSELGL